MQLLNLVLVTTTSATHIKGVAPKDMHLYAPDKNNMFTCVDYPSVKIPMDRVNDDYCDCPDGSDEPGTAACVNGWFWCAGSERYISSRYVGDGVCDYKVCCDGSDEAPGLCPDRCAEVKSAEAAKREAELAFIREGVNLRNEMVEKAKIRKQELTEEIKNLETQIQNMEQELQKKTSDLQSAKQSDEEDLSDPESVEALSEIRNVLKDVESDLFELSEQFIELKDSFDILDSAFREMSENYNPNFNDPAVKEAIKTWKNIANNEFSLPVLKRGDLLSDLELLDKIKIASVDKSSDTTHHGKWYSYVNNILPPVISSILRPRLEASSGLSSRKIEEDISSLSDSVDDLKQTLRVNKKLLELDTSFWGPDEIGRSAENLCVTIQRGDFRYEACLFGTAVQINGSHDVKLGTSTGLKQSQDGQLFIEFADGDACPNGVKRHTTIFLECGHETEAFSVGEPDTCHYVLEAKSPIACRLSLEEPDVVEHNEL